MLHRLSIFLLLMLLAACGSQSAPPTPTAPSMPAATLAPTLEPTLAATTAPTTQPTLAAPTLQPTQAAFPVTLTHKFGTTEILAEPKRVMALGYSEADPILALGVVPIAVRNWFGDQPDAIWPWSHPRLGAAKPTILTMPYGELNYETIAALKPDLIIATHSGITQAEYTTLAKIAPTLAQTGDVPDFGMSWQDQTKLIGRALGRSIEAEQLVADVEARILAARKAHPELNDKTIAWASPAEGGGFWVVGATTPPLRFLVGLGLRYPSAVNDFVGTADSQQLSPERLDLIDTDILIFHARTPAIRQTIESNPLYQQLKATKQGRVIFFEGNDPIYGALSYSTVASLPYALDRLIPLLSAAADGDPKTIAASNTD